MPQEIKVRKLDLIATIRPGNYISQVWALFALERELKFMGVGTIRTTGSSKKEHDDAVDRQRCLGSYREGRFVERSL
jgi:hypothetical protein